MLGARAREGPARRRERPRLPHRRHRGVPPGPGRPASRRDGARRRDVLGRAGRARRDRRSERRGEDHDAGGDRGRRAHQLGIGPVRRHRPPLEPPPVPRRDRLRPAGRHRPHRPPAAAHPSLCRACSGSRHRPPRRRSTVRCTRRSTRSASRSTQTCRSARSVAGSANAPASRSSCSPEPRVFFLDEPTSSLDPMTSAELVGHLRTLADRSAAVVFTTHSVADLAPADRIVFMGRGGRIGFVGTLDDAFASFGVTSVARALPPARHERCRRDRLRPLPLWRARCAPRARSAPKHGTDPWRAPPRNGASSRAARSRRSCAIR